MITAYTTQLRIRNKSFTSASNYGFQWGRQYSTKALRDERKVIVTRIA